MTESVTAASGKPQLDDQLAYWRNLKQQAESGSFRIDSDLATDLRDHAEDMRRKLVDLLTQANRLSTLGGFGALPSSLALKTAFATKANGGPESLVAQYGKAIDIVTLMRDTYELSIQKLTGQDAASAAAVAQTAGGV
ncbi:hypothetical protein [Nocardia sp. NPDC051570]|uniref:hypothetical protein n=1 Tax=Nocardia sp. NPDC051570 TaxID=3364324 RepID=UPI00379DAC56